MTFDEYKNKVYSDAIEWIDENYEFYEHDTADIAIDECMDSITGNSCGSYFCNSSRAAQEAAGVVFDADYWDAYDRIHGYGQRPDLRDEEGFDVEVRIVAFYEMQEKIEEYLSNMLGDVDE